MEVLHEYRQGRRWIARLPYGADLLQSLEQFAAAHDIKVGRLEVIGAVSKAVVAFYDQEKKEYGALEFNEPLEILCCTGNLSLREHTNRAHLHIILGRQDGSTRGGHLMSGTIVFAAEANIEELAGPELHRGFDPRTGLPLWEKD
ncbi:MAG: PPC domain-containing DNA-binding protein [Bacillota bacterium]